MQQGLSLKYVLWGSVGSTCIQILNISLDDFSFFILGNDTNSDKKLKGRGKLSFFFLVVEGNKEIKMMTYFTVAFKVSWDIQGRCPEGT